MTLNEAAAALGVAAATLRSQVRNGRLRATKRGRDWHVTPGEVERYRRESRGHPGRPSK
jgi:excisionase family DNA binding protein